MRLNAFGAALTMVIFPSLATAQDVTVGDLVITQTIALETPKSAMSGAGYLTITNNGESADHLIGISGDFPRVMIHDTMFENGVATMQHQDRVAIPAGQSVIFAPGGLHIMFMGLNGDPFEVGEEIPVTLTFENTGIVDLTLQVTTRDQAPVAAKPD